MSEVYESSLGPFYVRPTASVNGRSTDHLTICQAETDAVIATIPPRGGRANYGDAALLSSAPHMLETLIAIQERLMTSKETVDLEEINSMISQCFEKIHAEADV